MDNMEQHVASVLQQTEANAKTASDAELQRMIDTTQKELNMTAGVSLGLLVGSVVREKEQQPLKDEWELVVDVTEKEPVHKHLDLVINIHEQMLGILESEQWRRTDEKYLAKEIQRLPDWLPKQHVMFIIDRLWAIKNRPPLTTYKYQSNPEQIGAIDELFVKEAERRGLDVEMIARMTREEMHAFVESFRPTT